MPVDFLKIGPTLTLNCAKAPAAEGDCVRIPNEYKSIQTLRAVAALLVTQMHLQFFYGDSMQYFGGPIPRMSEFFYFKGFGGVGVQIFFVISGFIMAFLHAKGETSSFGDFAVRRITRIAPLYWVATLFWVFVLVGPSNVPLSKVLHSLFFIPQPDNMTVVGPGWSLNFEMFFYALFGFCTLVLRRSFLWIAVVFLALNAGFVVTGNYVMHLYSDPIVWNFFAGIAIYHVHRSPLVQREAVAFFTAGLLLLLSSIFWHLPDDSKGIRQFLPWSVPSMLIVLGAVSMEAAGRGARLFRTRTLLLMGDASYALYLFHGLCFFGVGNLLLHILKIQQFITPDGAIVIYLLVCCLIAVAVHQWIEKPSIKLARTLVGAVASLRARASLGKP